jgi:hypothetical protein
VDSRRMHFGSCLCGAVRFEVEGDFQRFYLVTADAAAKTQAPLTPPTCLRRGKPKMGQWEGCGHLLHVAIDATQQMLLLDLRIGTSL